MVYTDNRPIATTGSDCERKGIGLVLLKFEMYRHCTSHIRLFYLTYEYEYSNLSYYSAEYEYQYRYE